MRRKKLEQKKNVRVLICPLDWGLGHATRIVPIIKLLESHNFEVIVAADNLPLKFLKTEFPHLKTITFPSFKIKYSRTNSLVFKMLLSIPKIIFGIYKEHRQLKYLIEKHKIEIVISDNRFGLWNSSIYSVFISHQIHIQLPERLFFLQSLLYSIQLQFIKKYNECWIPDFEKQNSLAGKLSQELPLPSHKKHIGLLSRFLNFKITEKLNFSKFYIAAILSGPEPQRSIFEEKLLQQFETITHKILIVRGIENKNISIHYNKENICVMQFLNTNELYQVFMQVPVIICRSGYSSIMDLFALRKKAIIVPTPGQTEQEYLAKFHGTKGNFVIQNQNSLNILKGIEELNNLEFSEINIKSELLDVAIEKLCNKFNCIL